VISEVPKCSKIQIFRGSIPDPAGKLTALPQTPNLWGGDHCSPWRDDDAILAPSRYADGNYDGALNS